MSSKECFHFTKLDRLSSIIQYGLLPRLENNSKVVKDTAPKVSFSDGRYAAAALMADFYQVYCSIKNGTRDKSRTDPDMEKKILSSSSFEDFLGDGMYLMFDGSDIENTGGNNGQINPFDAGTTQTINPEKLKVCVLRDVETGELSYSKYEYAFYLMANLTESDKKRLNPKLMEEIEQFQQDHLEIAEKFSKHSFSEEIISIDEFQEILKSRVKKTEFFHDQKSDETFQLIESGLITISKADVVRVARKDEVVMEKENAIQEIKINDRDSQLKPENTQNFE